MVKDIGQKLEQELKTVPKNFVAQVECSTENYNSVVDSSINILLKKSKLNGIYITLNKPISVLIDQLQSKGVDTNRLFFIDGISGAAQRKEGGNKFVVLSGPTALTELSIEIAKAKETGKFDFIFFDAISTLLIYNSPKRCLQFSYFLLTKIRGYQFSGIIVYLKSDLEKEVFDSISHLSDKILKY